jgi:hypothetical protein
MAKAATVFEPALALTGETKALAEAAHARCDVARDGGAAAYAREIQAHAAHPAVQTHLLTTVAQLASIYLTSGDDAGLANLRAGVKDAVLRALRAGIDTAHAGVVSSAFYALANMHVQEPDALAEELMQAAMAALRGDGKLEAHASCEQLTAMAAFALNGVVSNHARNVARACDAGAVEALAAAMERFTGSELLHEGAGCALHACFARGGEQFRSGAAAVRAADAALAALRAFPAAPRVHTQCCLALGALVRDNSDMRARTIRAGCVDVFAATLRAYDGDAAVAEAACLALCNLGRAFRTCAAQVSASSADAALRAITSALQAHVTHAPTQEFGIKALAALSHHLHAARRVAASASAATLAAMRTHGGNVGVQNSGCIALEAMVDDSSRDNLGAAGAVGAAVGALRASTRSASRVARATAAGSPHHACDAAATAQCVELCQAHAIMLLLLLCKNASGVASGVNMLRALHAGVLRLQQDMRATCPSDLEFRRENLFAGIARLAATHASQQPGCQECAVLRARGEMCSHEGCGACSSAGAADGCSRLQLCSHCMTAAYCCAEHQRKAWHAGHKAECAALVRRRTAKNG